MGQRRVLTPLPRETSVQLPDAIELLWLGGVGFDLERRCFARDEAYGSPIDEVGTGFNQGAGDKVFRAEGDGATLHSRDQPGEEYRRLVEHKNEIAKSALVPSHLEAVFDTSDRVEHQCARSEPSIIIIGSDGQERGYVGADIDAEDCIVVTPFSAHVGGSSGWRRPTVPDRSQILKVRCELRFPKLRGGQSSIGVRQGRTAHKARGICETIIERRRFLRTARYIEPNGTFSAVITVDRNPIDRAGARGEFNQAGAVGADIIIV